MKDITTLIEKHGPEIAKNLQIASGQLYEKVLWYVQIDGIVSLIGYLLLIGIMVIVNLIGIKYAKIIWQKTDKYDRDGFWLFMCGIAFITVNALASLVIGGILATLLNSVAKIIAPEYWIIDQIINKVTS